MILRTYLFLVELVELLLNGLRLDILNEHRPAFFGLSDFLELGGFLADHCSSSEGNSDSVNCIGKDFHH